VLIGFRNIVDMFKVGVTNMEDVLSISNKTRKFSRVYILLITITTELNKNIGNNHIVLNERCSTGFTTLFFVYGLCVRRPPGLVFHKFMILHERLLKTS